MKKLEAIALRLEAIATSASRVEAIAIRKMKKSMFGSRTEIGSWTYSCTPAAMLKDAMV